MPACRVGCCPKDHCSCTDCECLVPNDRDFAARFTFDRDKLFADSELKKGRFSPPPKICPCKSGEELTCDSGCCAADEDDATRNDDECCHGDAKERLLPESEKTEPGDGDREARDTVTKGTSDTETCCDSRKGACPRNESQIPLLSSDAEDTVDDDIPCEQETPGANGCCENAEYDDSGLHLSRHEHCGDSGLAQTADKSHYHDTKYPETESSSADERQKCHEDENAGLGDGNPASDHSADKGDFVAEKEPHSCCEKKSCPSGNSPNASSDKCDEKLQNAPLKADDCCEKKSSEKSPNKPKGACQKGVAGNPPCCGKENGSDQKTRNTSSAICGNGVEEVESQDACSHVRESPDSSGGCCGQKSSREAPAASRLSGCCDDETCADGDAGQGAMPGRKQSCCQLLDETRCCGGSVPTQMQFLTVNYAPKPASLGDLKHHEPDPHHGHDHHHRHEYHHDDGHHHHSHGPSPDLGHHHDHDHHHHDDDHDHHHHDDDHDHHHDDNHHHHHGDNHHHHHHDDNHHHHAGDHHLHDHQVHADNGCHDSCCSEEQTALDSSSISSLPRSCCETACDRNSCCLDPDCVASPSAASSREDIRPLVPDNISVNASISAMSVNLENGEPVRQTTKLRVQNMCCPKESAIVEEELNKLHGIYNVRVNVIGRVVHVSHRPDIVSPTELMAILNKRHLGVSIVDTGEEAGQTGFPTSLKLVLANLVVQAVLFAVALAATFSDQAWAMWVAIVVICVGVLPVLKRAAISLWNYDIDLNVLISITVIGTLAVQEWVEGAAVVFVFTLANFLQQFCFYRVHKTISSLMLSKPSKAVMACTGECLPIEQVPIGSIIAVRQGELIPLDGVVVKGGASVDESSISGEATPVEKTLNSETYSGTVIQHGYLEIETTSTATSSTISKISEMVEDAQMNSSPTEILVNKFAKYYTPLVVLLAALVFLIPLFLGLGGVSAYQGKIKMWGERALIVLVTACPCALLMATPIVVIGGINAAAKLGALIKGGTFLEGLAQITFLAFDKTGTLTEGKFQVVDIIPLSKFSETDALRLTAALESKSSHPLAAAVVSEFTGECIADFVADSEELNLPEVTDFCTLEGQGISGTVEGHRIDIGNKALLDKLGVALTPKCHATFVDYCNESKTVIFVCVDGQLALMISLADIIRKESREALSWLRELDVHLAMLTGDSRHTALAVQKDLKIDSCIAEMKPDDKLQWISDMNNEMIPARCFRRKRNHVVGMVGDGVNDGPALAAADVGIAMAAGGSALAVEAAGVALMTNSVLKVPEMICLSRFCRRIIVQNVVLAVVLKLAFVVIALTGSGSVWMAVLADLVGLVAVITNGIRPLRWQPPSYRIIKQTPPSPRVSWRRKRPIFQYESMV